MEMQNGGNNTGETQTPGEKRENGESASKAPLKPIADFVTRPDYPECLVGEHVDIGGYVGVVTAVVKQSIKVRSPEGATRGFNSHGLRRIYGPPPEPEPVAPLPPPPSPSSLSTVPDRAKPASLKPAPPKPEVVEEPNFEQPVVKIGELVTRPDFPKCALGMHVDIGGYTGVVVELINQASLKVRVPQGTSRTYNAVGLKKIYGPQ